MFRQQGWMKLKLKAPLWHLSEEVLQSLSMYSNEQHPIWEVFLLTVRRSLKTPQVQFLTNNLTVKQHTDLNRRCERDRFSSCVCSSEATNIITLPEAPSQRSQHSSCVTFRFFLGHIMESCSGCAAESALGHGGAVLSSHTGTGPLHSHHIHITANKAGYIFNIQSFEKESRPSFISQVWSLVTTTKRSSEFYQVLKWGIYD